MKYKYCIEITNNSGCCLGKPFIILFGEINDNEYSGSHFDYKYNENKKNFTVSKIFESNIVYSITTDKITISSKHNTKDVFDDIFKDNDSQSFKL